MDHVSDTDLWNQSGEQQGWKTHTLWDQWHCMTPLHLSKSLIMVTVAAWDRFWLDDLFFPQVLVKTLTILCTRSTTVVCLAQTTSGNCLTGPHISNLWCHSWTADVLLCLDSPQVFFVNLYLLPDRVCPRGWGEDPVPSQALPSSSSDQLPNVLEPTPSSQIAFRFCAASLVLLFKQQRSTTASDFNSHFIFPIDVHIMFSCICFAGIKGEVCGDLHFVHSFKYYKIQCNQWNTISTLKHILFYIFAKAYGD